MRYVKIWYEFWKKETIGYFPDNAVVSVTLARSLKADLPHFFQDQGKLKTLLYLKDYE